MRPGLNTIRTTFNDRARERDGTSSSLGQSNTSRAMVRMANDIEIDKATSAKLSQMSHSRDRVATSSKQGDEESLARAVQNNDLLAPYRPFHHLPSNQSSKYHNLRQSS